MSDVRTLASVAYAGDLEEALAAPGVDVMRVAEDLFGLSDVVKGDPRLARAMTDPSRSANDKSRLVRDAFASHVQEATLRVLDALVADHWSKPHEVEGALEVLGIVSVLTDALRAGVLDQVRGELFEVRYFLQHHRELRVRLSDLSSGDAHRRGDLASAVFEGRINAWTMRLVRRAVGRSHHGRLLHNIRRYAQWAATMQNRLFVTVATAAPMKPQQVERLRDILSRRFNAPIDLAISLDPAVIGGFRLRAGMSAVDASLSSRLNAARSAISAG